MQVPTSVSFVVCFPVTYSYAQNPNQGSGLNFTSVGEPISSGNFRCAYFDSISANEWITRHSSSKLIQELTSLGVSGPLTDLITPDQPALAFFARINTGILKRAQLLSNDSGYPVIIYPLTACPINSQTNSSTHDASCGNEESNRSLNGDLIAPEDTKKPFPGNTQDGELVSHSVSISVRIPCLNQSTTQGNTPSVDNMNFQSTLYFYPNPNAVANLGMKTPNKYDRELGVQVNMKARSGTQIHSNYVRISFIDPNLETHYSASKVTTYSRNKCSNLKYTFKESTESQRKHETGIVGGNPVATGSMGYQASSEQGDEAIQQNENPEWLVKRLNPIMRTNTSLSHQFSIYPSSLVRNTPSDVRRKFDVTYGMTMRRSVASPQTQALQSGHPGPSFLHYQQIHFWTDKSTKKPRGVILVIAHRIPDACTKLSSELMGEITLNFDSDGTERIVSIDGETQEDCLNSSLCESSPLLVSSWDQISSCIKGHIPSLGSLFCSSTKDEEEIPLHCLVPDGWDYTNDEWFRQDYQSCPDEGLNLAESDEGLGNVFFG